MRGRRFAILGLLIIAGLCLTLFYSGWAFLVAAWKTERSAFETDKPAARFVLVGYVQHCLYFDGFGVHQTVHDGDYCERIVKAHSVS